MTRGYAMLLLLAMSVGVILGTGIAVPGGDSVVVDLTKAHIRCLGLESSEEHGWQREHKADQRGVPLDASGVEYKRRLSASARPTGWAAANTNGCRTAAMVVCPSSSPA